MAVSVEGQIVVKRMVEKVGYFILFTEGKKLKYVNIKFEKILFMLSIKIWISLCHFV